jgi:hypothetical protein
MINLSPAAQVVLDAYWDDAPLESGARCGLAAALRAVADQVVPENTGISYTKQDIRAALLAIADELDGHA